MLDERSILVAQIEGLEENLKKTILLLGSQQIPSELRNTAGSCFSKMIRNRQRELEKLRENVNRDLSMEGCWHMFKNINLDCAPLFSECLAFLEGALLRSARLDDGICQIADALLDEMSRKTGIYWNRITFLAEKDFFAQITDIIRLRFPEFSIWNLPVSGHEFGHFVAQELREKTLNGLYRYPIQEILQREQGTMPFLVEYFADLFAVYALGPAFAYTFIVLNVDHRQICRDKPEHPSDAKRIHFILQALEKIDETHYVGEIEILRKLWQKSLASAKWPEEFSQAIQQLNIQLNEFLIQLNKHLPNEVCFSSWNQASLLSWELPSDKEAIAILEDFDHEVSLSDVLNAAWICRRKHWDENSCEDSRLVNKISKKAIEMCYEIIYREQEFHRNDSAQRRRF